MRYGIPWTTEREKHRRMADDEWRSWFAWYPVRLDDGTWAWRETVEYSQPMRYNLPSYRALGQGGKEHESSRRYA